MALDRLRGSLGWLQRSFLLWDSLKIGCLLCHKVHESEQYLSVLNMLTREPEEAYQACFLLHSEVQAAIIYLLFCRCPGSWTDSWPPENVTVVAGS